VLFVTGQIAPPTQTGACFLSIGTRGEEKRVRDMAETNRTLNCARGGFLFVKEKRIFANKEKKFLHTSAFGKRTKEGEIGTTDSGGLRGGGYRAKSGPLQRTGLACELLQIVPIGAGRGKRSGKGRQKNEKTEFLSLSIRTGGLEGGTGRGDEPEIGSAPTIISLAKDQRFRRRRQLATGRRGFKERPMAR